MKSILSTIFLHSNEVNVTQMRAFYRQEVYAYGRSKKLD